MARRRRRPRATGGGSDGAKAPTPIRFLAAEIFGNNPRLVASDGKRTALLKIEPAANTRLYYTRRGERIAIEGVVGAAVVLEDPEELLEFDDRGRMRIRVLSVDELEAFGWRLVRYAQLLRITNAMGIDVKELAAAYFNGGGRGRGDQGAVDEEEGDEEPGVEADMVEDEVS